MEKWLIFVTALLLVGCGSGGDVVTVYTSQDQVYAEPILREFEQQTGISVRAVYDSEAVKTVGLVNRLIAEKANRSATCFGTMKSSGLISSHPVACWIRASRWRRLAHGRVNGFGTPTN